MMERWTDFQRLEGWAGEVRVNFVRMAALVAFYAYHLINVYVLDSANLELRGNFHMAVTALSIAWSFQVLLLHFALSRRFVPPWLKYAALVWDTFMATMLLVILGGPKSPMVILYFLIIASSALRLSLRLVWAATFACLLAWLFLLGYTKIYLSAELQPARTAQIQLALGMGAAGLMAGQMVRQARRIAIGYPVTVEPK